MTVDEYMGWLKFFEKRAEEERRQAEGKGGNLLKGSKGDLIKGLTGGNIR